MIELVIKIPREKYKAITEMYETFPKDMKEWGLEAIKNGTPIPKGHGDLIERRCGNKACNGCEHSDICDTYNAPTIIEADKESDTDVPQ